MCQTTRFHEHLAYRDILKRLPCSWYAWSYSAALSICRDKPYLFRQTCAALCEPVTMDEICCNPEQGIRGTENKFVVIFIGDFIWTMKLWVSIDIFTCIRKRYISNRYIMPMRVACSIWCVWCGVSYPKPRRPPLLLWQPTRWCEDRYATWTLGSSTLKALKRNIGIIRPRSTPDSRAFHGSFMLS